MASRTAESEAKLASHRDRRAAASEWPRESAAAEKAEISSAEAANAAIEAALLFPYPEASEAGHQPALKSQLAVDLHIVTSTTTALRANFFQFLRKKLPSLN